MLRCRDGVEVDNKTGRLEVCPLHSETVRACLEGSMFDRAKACASIAPGELFQVFGEKRIDYGRKLARAGARLRHPMVVEALREAGQRAILAAARFEDPQAQLRAASLAIARAVRR